MKNLVFVGSVVAALAGAALAGQVDVAFAPFQTGSGGEFQVIKVVGGGYPGKTGLFADVASNSFQSFCIEYTEHINVGRYSFTIDAGAINGGAGGGNPDPVSPATAWLYSNFRNGTLPTIAYNFGGPQSFTYVYGAGRQASASIVQSALWMMEDEPDANGQTGQNAAARDAIIAYAQAATANTTSTFGVRALNLFTDNNNNGVYDNGDTPNQSFLTIIPLPTGSGLALAGLGGLAIRRRRTA